eukprot:8030873-Prorocentrum_lima.AAC.1
MEIPRDKRPRDLVQAENMGPGQMSAPMLEVDVADQRLHALALNAHIEARECRAVHVWAIGL